MTRDPRPGGKAPAGEARPVYLLRLEALPRDVPAGRRLAGLLEVALRAFGFRCLGARELSAGAAGEQASALPTTEGGNGP